MTFTYSTPNTTWANGDLPDADDLNAIENNLGAISPMGGVLNYYVKKSGNTTVNNSTTQVTCTDMAFPIAASEEWEFEFTIFGTSGTTPDWDFSVTAPAGVSKIKYGVSPGQAISPAFVSGSGGIVSANGLGFDQYLTVRGLVVNGSTAGTIQLKFAQHSADASNSIVYADSFTVARRRA